MNAAPQTAYMFPDMPPTIKATRTVAGLVLGPNSSIRRFLTATRDTIEDVSGCLSKSKPIDVQRDELALSIQRQTLIGEKNAVVKGCGCEQRFRAIRADSTAEIALDAEIDTIVWVVGWDLIRRVLGAIECAFTTRKRGAASARRGVRS